MYKRQGIGCALTSLLGGFSSTSYSENVGLIGLTKVGSRFVVQIAAVILILLGLFGKFGALAASIPSPIVGGLYCALFGLISAVGVKELMKADLNVDRNLFIAGFSLFMGLSFRSILVLLKGANCWIALVLSRSACETLCNRLGKPEWLSPPSLD